MIRKRGNSDTRQGIPTGSMPHQTPLLTAIVVGIGIAFLLGAIANRLRISPLVGYLLAGVVGSPHTPGFAADQSLVNQLAEIGVILLMFGVGMHFSFKDLVSVRAIAIPGALGRIAVGSLLGVALAWLLDWNMAGGFVFGLALSVASTVVLLRALQERHLLDSEWGRIAVGWLIVEDLAMVLVLVLLPALATLFHDGDAGMRINAHGVPQIVETVAITLGKVVAFLALMLVVGRRVIPWILHYVAHTGSRELFRLAVLAIALGVAYGAAELFDVSFALGAFFAGMVLAESELSQQAANETLPLRDAFAVLFFVSVGMLFDPQILVRDPWAVLATLFIILVGKSVVAFMIVLAFKHPAYTAATIAASLAQIGEFSFILASLGIDLGLMTERGRDLILAGAILSILANPALLYLVERLRPWFERHVQPSPDATAAAPPKPVELPVTHLTEHAVVIGYGRVGSAIGDWLQLEGQRFFVIEAGVTAIEQLRARGIEAIAGNAAAPEILRTANIAAARWVFVAVPNAFEAGQIVEQARDANPTVKIVARAHFDGEVEHLKQLGADVIIMGEREIARAMFDRAFDNMRVVNTG
jgi:monovalent cation:H+ antiporter-2, CPA2 family